MSSKVEYACSVCGKSFTRFKAFNKNQKILCHGCGIKQYYIEHPEKNLERKAKAKETLKRNYGVTNPSFAPSVKEKISKNLSEKWNKDREEILKKRIDTNRKKFGYDHASQNPEITKKGIETQRSRNNGYLGWEDPNKQKISEKAAHKEEANKKRVQTMVERFNSKTVVQGSGNSNHLKGYLYKNIRFDSSWELALYIYLEDNNRQFLYHPGIYFEYEDEENFQKHTCWPDFLIEGQFYELKGEQFFNEKNEPFNKYTKKFWWGKYNALAENNVKILRLEDIKVYLRYIKDKYGKTYLKSFKVK